MKTGTLAAGWDVGCWGVCAPKSDSFAQHPAVELGYCLLTCVGANLRDVCFNVQISRVNFGGRWNIPFNGKLRVFQTVNCSPNFISKSNLEQLSLVGILYYSSIHNSMYVIILLFLFYFIFFFLIFFFFSSSLISIWLNVSNISHSSLMLVCRFQEPRVVEITRSYSLSSESY